MEHPGRRSVVMFAMGGTIASASSAGSSGARVSLTGEDLLRAIPGLDSVARVRVRSLRQVPSGDLTMKDVLELVVEIRREIEGGASGVVVAQGTDTLEEVAFLLDLLIETDAPIVVTGAMRNASLPGSDGPANLLAALKVAASEEARGIGALVVFNDEVHAARFVRKRHPTSTATFGSPLTGPLGIVVEDRVRLFMRPRGRVFVELPPSPPDIKVALVSIVFDDEGDLLSEKALAPYQGVVVAAFGAGHVPRRIVSRLRELNERMPVVVASRTFGGEMLKETYGYPGGEMDLLANGLVFAGGYEALHARILLQLLLMAAASKHVIASTFATGLTNAEPVIVRAQP